MCKGLFFSFHPANFFFFLTPPLLHQHFTPSCCEWIFFSRAYGLEMVHSLHLQLPSSRSIFFFCPPAWVMELRCFSNDATAWCRLLLHRNQWNFVAVPPLQPPPPPPDLFLCNCNQGLGIWNTSGSDELPASSLMSGTVFVHSSAGMILTQSYRGLGSSTCMQS